MDIIQYYNVTTIRPQAATCCNTECSSLKDRTVLNIALENMLNSTTHWTVPTKLTFD